MSRCNISHTWKKKKTPPRFHYMDIVAPINLKWGSKQQIPARSGYQKPAPWTGRTHCLKNKQKKPTRNLYTFRQECTVLKNTNAKYFKGMKGKTRLKNQTLKFISMSAFSFLRLENVQFHFICKSAQFDSWRYYQINGESNLCIKLLFLQTFIHFAIHQLHTNIYVHAL